MKKRIRILIVDDHSLMRVGLVNLLNLEADLTVVAEASTGQQAIELYEKHHPDVVIMDLRMPGLSGDETITRLAERYPDVKVLALSSYDLQEQIFRAVQAGARAFLPKDVVLEELLNAIRIVHEGGDYLPPAIAARLMERMRTPELSPREGSVLQLLAKGHSNKEIANVLSIAETTVKDHVSNILTKLGAADRTQATTTAIQRGLVQLD
ncbi:MAG TPA: DNA-binding response regulator [Verrucomicrobiales bacterium]|nr:DNA-binding response regulator [Verrucomicrobiales bacterium]